MQLGDLALEHVALAVETGGLLALALLRVREDLRRLRLGVGDELVALRLALGDVLVVQALRQLDDAGRGGGRGRGSDLSDRGRGDRRWGLLGGGRLLAGLVGGKLRLELGVLVQRLAPLENHLVQEVVDLVRVEAVLETDVLELLGDDVIRGQCHGWLLFR